MAYGSSAEHDIAGGIDGSLLIVEREGPVVHVDGLPIVAQRRGRNGGGCGSGSGARSSAGGICVRRGTDAIEVRIQSGRIQISKSSVRIRRVGLERTGIQPAGKVHDSGTQGYEGAKRDDGEGELAVCFHGNENKY